MKYVLAIDQSTSGTKAALMDNEARFVRKESKRHKQYYPAPGRVEHDAAEIWSNVCALINEVGAGVEIGALAIANQRETSVVWDRQTGEPVNHAIVWQDVRGEYLERELAASADMVYNVTGLKLSAYYPSLKLAALFRERPELLARAKNGELCTGTIDSYLMYRLTNGRVYATDVSNASRTQLFDIRKLQWSDELLALFDIPRCAVPERVLLSDSHFGDTDAGIPIHTAIGDSHASLFGHGCVSAGMAKTSYGTGSSIMLNTGATPVFSTNGLSTSVAFGRGGQVSYVLEGNVTCSADTLIWLRDEVGLIDSLDNIEQQAASVPDAQGVVLVPALSGLGAPYFDGGARGVIAGLNRGTTKAHILRAALDSIAHQNADVLDAMAADMGSPVDIIHADGGGSENALLMQTQADITPCKAACAAEKDLTLWGAGVIAGTAAGLIDGEPRSGVSKVYEPRMSADARLAMRNEWALAIRRARLV